MDALAFFLAGMGITLLATGHALAGAIALVLAFVAGWKSEDRT